MHELNVTISFQIRKISADSSRTVNQYPAVIPQLRLSMVTKQDWLGWVFKEEGENRNRNFLLNFFFGKKWKSFYFCWFWFSGFEPRLPRSPSLSWSFKLAMSTMVSRDYVHLTKLKCTLANCSHTKSLLSSLYFVQESQ